MTERTLGHYRVLDKIGEGGMGAVYRARDTKLERDVAIKVLPDDVSSDPDRLARFQREAKVLASVNHPNVAGIHELGEHNGTTFLVLELVEGEELSLAEKHSVQETLELARQMVDALEEAHGKGIVHRDLKPANVKLTADGQVKILDFGLAKALGQDSTTSGVDEQLSNSPTIARATVAGVILGTASYMSPEQARGQIVDARSDIWSFGVVVFELLARRPLFEGGTASDVLAAVLRAEIEWDRLPAETPPSIERLLRRCLARDPKQRLQHIGDARLEIRDALSESVRVAAPIEPASRSSGRAVALIAALSFGVGALLASFLAVGPQDAPVRRFPIALDTTARVEDRLFPLVAISPFGDSIVYPNEGQLYRLQLDRHGAEPLMGTEESRQPFFSPDGQWIAFHTGRELSKVRFDGSAAVKLADVDALAGGDWNDDTIVFSRISDGSLHRVPATGGDPEALPVGNTGGIYWPDVLPGGRSVLGTAPPAIIGGLGAEWNVWAVPVEDDAPPPRKLVDAATAPRFVPTGHLAFQRGDAIYAQRFDPERLEFHGEARPVISDVSPGSFLNAAPQWDFARDGTLVYARSPPVRARSLVWVDRAGQESSLAVAEQQYLSPRISPDGERVALANTPAEGGGREIWTLALDGGAFTRLTFGTVLSTDPVWSPSGATLAFAQTSGGGGSFGVVTQESTGIAVPVERTNVDNTNLERTVFARAWTPDGRFLLVERLGVRSIGTLAVDDNTLEFTQKSYDESQPSVSPDGRYLAYASTESGQWEIFLRSFPDDGRKWQVSTNGGREPVFSPDGREIFYRGDGQMMAAGIVTEPEVRIDTPSVLFEDRYAFDPFGGDSRNYDVAPDGRFLMIQGSETRAEVVVILNWFRELEELVPEPE